VGEADTVCMADGDAETALDVGDVEGDGLLASLGEELFLTLGLLEGLDEREGVELLSSLG